MGISQITLIFIITKLINHLNIKIMAKAKSQSELLKEKEQLVKQALGMDLDSINLDNLEERVNNPTPKAKATKKASTPKSTKAPKAKKPKLYKIEVNKTIRKNIRKKRNSFITNILNLHKEGNKTNLNKEVKSFTQWYKEIYTLNDFTPESIMATNSDKDTKEMVSQFFNILKELKVK